MPSSGLGRKSVAEKYIDSHTYLNEYVLKVKDLLFQLKERELIKRKEHQSAQNKVNLQQKKLDSAYEGFERWRK